VPQGRRQIDPARTQDDDLGTSGFEALTSGMGGPLRREHDDP
jgi:hypothetical protein